MARGRVGWLVVLALVGLANGSLWGVYDTNEQRVEDLAVWTQKPLSLRLLNIGWDKIEKLPGVFQQIQSAWEGHQVPVVTWMPYPYLTWTNPEPNVDIVQGVYTEYVNAFLTGFKDFLAGPDGVYGNKDDRRAYLRFAPEANGDWFPWSPSCPPCGQTGQKIDQTSLSYVYMWKYIYDKVRTNHTIDADHVQMVFTANSEDAYNMGWKMEDFYPGDTMVDWVAEDGFNWGTSIPGHQWADPAASFSPMQKRLLAVSSNSKPFGLTSYSSTTTPNGVSAKNDWLASTAKEFNTSNTEMFILQNVDSQTDWGVFGGKNGLSNWVAPSGFSYNVYPGFNTSIKPSYVLGADFNMPGLISDKAFKTGSN